VSRFIDGIVRAATTTDTGLHFGAPGELQRLPWRDILGTGQQISGALAAAGVTRGDRVGVLAAYAQDVAPVTLGVWGCGAALTMLQQPTPQADLDQWHAATLGALEMLGARVVVVGEPFGALVDVLVDAGHRVVPIAEEWPVHEGQPIAPAEDDVALYQLTSGSTGQPKGVAITHANLFANAEAMRDGAAADASHDVMASWLPLSHDMGLVGFLLTPMYLGMKTVYVSPTEFLKSPLNWMRLLSDEGATITAAPNFAYSIIHRRLKAIDDGAYDLSRLRFVLCGAEPIDPTTIREFTREANRFGMAPEAIVAAYGLAEATLAVSFATVGRGVCIERLDNEAFETRGRAVHAADADGGAKEVVVLGPPLPGMAVKVIDSGGAEMAARQLGELLICGPAVTRGYATVDGELGALDGRGWLHTGDLGYLTDTGEVVVCGRLKNVIIVAGRNIFPSDLERIAESADGVRRGAVIAFGVVRPDGREEITIVAETDKLYDAETSREIRRHIVRSVYSAIGLSPTVLLVDKGAIPKTPSGKIRHVEAKQVFGAAK
jgi:fatty-acyl-CoA synthase